MTKWTKVEFSDLREGDTIKTVNEVGTIRIGTVTHFAPGFYSDGEWFDGFACEAKGQLLAMEGDYAYYRRTPKFVALDVPEVGQWIAATLRDGRVVSGRVYTVLDYSRTRTGMFMVSVEGNAGLLHLPTEATPVSIRTGDGVVTRWTPIDPPTPAEPTGFGYVGCVTTPDGATLQVWRATLQVWRATEQSGLIGFSIADTGNGDTDYGLAWWEVLLLGTFTPVTR